MATQKPISTISYNTVPFLREKLDLWVSSHIIQAYQFIFHRGEDGDKDHIHLRVEPNKKLDPMDLSDQLLEYQFGNDKPLGCRPWRPSKEEDWYLYAVHDKQYLAIKYSGGDKGEKLPYSYHDIQVSQNYDLDIAFLRAQSSLKHSSVNLMSRLSSGSSPLSLVLDGESPFLINSLTTALMRDDYTRAVNRIVELETQLSIFSSVLFNFRLSIGVDPADGLYKLYDLDGNLITEISVKK